MTTPKPALPEPDLLVECAQGFVRGWTELKVRAAIAAAVADARAEIANLKTVMIAAAEEIAAHWDAHCDAEGYGPQNLMRRLEEGIPSEYGYTAGAFAELKAKAEARAVPEGCACRWDADDNRVQTCERHQGWLDVIAEWSDRARAAEAALAATPSPAEQPKPAVLELPKRIRVPLHRLWADAGYLVGRAKCGEVDLSVHTIKSLCDELERAILAALQGEPHDKA